MVYRDSFYNKAQYHHRRHRIFFFPLPLWVDRVPLQQTMVVIYDLMKGRVPVFEKALQEFDTLLLFPFASPFHSREYGFFFSFLILFVHISFFFLCWVQGGKGEQIQDYEMAMSLGERYKSRE